MIYVAVFLPFLRRLRRGPAFAGDRGTGSELSESARRLSRKKGQRSFHQPKQGWKDGMRYWTRRSVVFVQKIQDS